MTREEAIKIFNTVLFFGKCDCPKEEIEECLKMAIKALEQEPTTKIDCDKTDCNNCVNHKCCDYELTTKNDLGVERHKQNIQTYAHDFGVSEEQAEKELRINTKNDLGVDCISRADAIQAMQDKAKKLTNEDTINGLCGAVAILFDLPSVTTKNDLGVDAVSRKAVINQIFYSTDNNGDVVLGSALRERIARLPSVTPQEPRWIPVSEKLPDPFTFVNATCRSLVDDREDWVVETIYSPIPKEANKHGYSDWGNIPMLNWGEAEVIAWVERIIPQPYKAESEET